MKFVKNTSAGFLTNQMARLFASRLQEKFRPLNLAPAQFMVLLELWNKDGLTQKQLTERLDVEQATIANTLTRMERDGLITRKQDDTDGRARTNHLTQKANALSESATSLAASVNNQALSALSTKEIEQFISTAQKIITALKP